MPPSPAYACFIGIDIAATTFVATWAESSHVPTRPSTFAQTETGFAAFQAQLPAHVTPAQVSWYSVTWGWVGGISHT